MESGHEASLARWRGDLFAKSFPGTSWKGSELETVAGQATKHEATSTASQARNALTIQ